MELEIIGSAVSQQVFLYYRRIKFGKTWSQLLEIYELAINTSEYIFGDIYIHNCLKYYML